MIDIIALAVAAIAAVISGLAYYHSQKAYKQTVDHDRKRDTLDAFNTLQNEAFDKLNLFSPSEIQEISKHPTSKEYKQISGYIARIEHFCVGVNTEIYDKETVFQLAHGYLDSDTILGRITPIIERKHRGAEQDYYENIHRVLTWMKEKGKVKL